MKALARFFVKVVKVSSPVRVSTVQKSPLRHALRRDTWRALSTPLLGDCENEEKGLRKVKKYPEETIFY